MAPSASSSRSPRSTDTSIWIILGITAFVFVDIVLIGWAITGQRAPIPTAAPIVPASTPAASITPSATTDPTESAAPVVAPALRFLDATTATAAWRATPGACDAASDEDDGPAAEIESSTDAGATWTSHDSGDSDIRQVLSLEAVSESTAFIVAKSGPDCGIRFFRTFSTGDTWQEAPDELGSQSYLDPSAAASIVIDGESVQAPCAVVRQLVTDGFSHVAVCDDAAYSLDAGTGEWVGLERSNLVAVAVADGAAAVVEWGDAECPALGFAMTNAAVLAAPPAASCAPGDAVPAAFASDLVDDDLWLWQDDSTTVVPAG